MNMLQAMRNEHLTKTDLNDLNKALEKKFEAIDTKIEDQNTKIEELDSRLSQFEHWNAASAYGNELQKQKLLKNNLGIIGIPVRERERELIGDCDVYLQAANRANRREQNNISLSHNLQQQTISNHRQTRGLRYQTVNSGGES